MRIGYLTYGLDRSPTGIGRHAIGFLQTMYQLREEYSPAEIVLLTTERSDPHQLWSQFERIHLPGCSLLPTLMTIGNVLLSYAAKRHGLDLIHDHNGIAPFLGPRLGIPRIVTIHDTFAYVHANEHNRLDNWRYRWLLPEAARRADAIITPSQCSRNDIITHLNPPSTPIYHVPLNAVDAIFTPISDNPERQAVLEHYGITPPYILYVGGINARKNIARIFEAYAKIRDRYPNVPLVIAGKRQWRTTEIEATYKRLELGDSVQFTGYVENKHLPYLYSAASLLLFPSLYEGFGLPPVEAMSCGTPVVTSNISSLPEAVGDAALLVDPYSVDAIADAMCRILDDPSLAKQLRTKGFKQAAMFTWRRATQEIVAIYQRVLNYTS